MKIILIFMTSIPFDVFRVQGSKVQRFRDHLGYNFFVSRRANQAQSFFPFELSPFSFEL
jgi:hypothetical protein